MVGIVLGCGFKPKAGWVNYDISPQFDFVKKLDLEKDSFPHEDNSIDYIEAIDVLEHLHDLRNCLNESWRVLKREGVFYLEVPKFPHPDSVKDPTHVRFFVAETFKYFSEYEKSYTLYDFKPWNIVGIQEEENRLEVRMTPRK